MKRRTFLRLTGAASGAALWPWWSVARAQRASRAKVVIIGGGFAGSACALQLRQLNPAMDVALVDPDATYTTCPMSNGVLAGTREMQSIRVSRRGVRRCGIRYVHDRAVSLDTHERRVGLAGGRALPYDRVVVATGIRLLWGRPEGYSEQAALRMPHAWLAGVQTEILASQIRGLRGGGVVAISVPTGPMRCPPGPFERASLIAGYLRAAKPRSKILIFDSNNHFPRQDEFMDAWRSLYPGMIEWISVVDGGAVERVDASRGLVVNGAGEHRIDVANIIPPQAPALLAVQAGLASDHGWCPVKPLSFESTLADDVSVIGDSCIADPMPKSASAACSQGLQCAVALTAALAGREPPAAELDSVCYSFLSADTALSIRGQFRATGAGFEQRAAVRPSEVNPGEEAVKAEQWYRGILRQAFAVQAGL